MWLICYIIYRLNNVMGYEKADLISHLPFEFHHHDDVEATLECSRGRTFLYFLF